MSDAEEVNPDVRTFKRTPKKRKNYLYNESHKERLRLALEDIKNQTLSQRAASKKYNIPRTTLINKLQGYYKTSRAGPPTILTEAEENRLVEWLKHMSRIGYGQCKNELLQNVEKIVSKDERKFFFNKTNGKPGKSWYRSFMRRHPDVSNRLPEQLGKERAVVSEKVLRKWFHDLKSALESECPEEGIHILDDPCRVYNCDESGFPLSGGKRGKVLAPRGARSVYQFTTSDKLQMTVLAAANAAGNYIPPYVLYPGKRLKFDPFEDAEMPEGSAFGCSEKGWMTTENFFEWICNHFDKSLVREHVQKPVVLFLDGHGTHVGLETAEYCSQNGIILCCFIAHASHIQQPLDVAVFRPLKVSWRECIKEWNQRNIGEVVSKRRFAQVFAIAWRKASLRQAAINGFRKTGLCPYNPEAPDYSKCTIASLFSQTVESQDTSDHSAAGTSEELCVADSEVVMENMLNDIVSVVDGKKTVKRNSETGGAKRSLFKRRRRESVSQPSKSSLGLQLVSSLSNSLADRPSTSTCSTAQMGISQELPGLSTHSDDNMKATVIYPAFEQTLEGDVLATFKRRESEGYNLNLETLLSSGVEPDLKRENILYFTWKFLKHSAMQADTEAPQHLTIRPTPKLKAARAQKGQVNTVNATSESSLLRPRPTSKEYVSPEAELYLTFSSKAANPSKKKKSVEDAGIFNKVLTSESYRESAAKKVKEKQAKEEEIKKRKEEREKRRIEKQTLAEEKKKERANARAERLRKQAEKIASKAGREKCNQHSSTVSNRKRKRHRQETSSSDSSVDLCPSLSDREGVEISNPEDGDQISHTVARTAEPGDWVAVIFNEKWYPGSVLSKADGELVVNFMKPLSAESSIFTWPAKKDIIPVQESSIMCRIFRPPEPINARNHYAFPDTDKLDDLLMDIA